MAGEADEGDPRDAVDAILDGAMAGDDLGPVLAVAGAALCRAGVPIVRASLGMPAIDPTIRGLSWVWWRDDGSGCGGAGQVELVETLHGPESDEAFRAGPIHHMRERDLTTCRWRLDGTAATAPDTESFPLFSELGRRGVTEFAMRLVPFGTGSLIGAAFGIATDRRGGFTDADLAAADRLLPALALAAYRMASRGSRRRRSALISAARQDCTSSPGRSGAAAVGSCAPPSCWPISADLPRSPGEPIRLMSSAGSTSTSTRWAIPSSNAAAKS
jgi:adenylate cyclase